MSFGLTLPWLVSSWSLVLSAWSQQWFDLLILCFELYDCNAWLHTQSMMEMLWLGEGVSWHQ